MLSLAANSLLLPLQFRLGTLPHGRQLPIELLIGFSSGHVSGLELRTKPRRFVKTTSQAILAESTESQSKKAINRQLIISMLVLVIIGLIALSKVSV